MNKICPAIISSDFLNIKSDCEELSRTKAEILHIDVMDGYFAPQISFGHQICKSIINNCTIDSEIHLAIGDIDKFIHQFINIGAKRLILPIEKISPEFFNVFNKQKNGISFGLAILPETDIRELIPFIENIDKVTILATQPCSPVVSERTIPKIEELSNLLRELDCSNNVVLQIDGGVKSDNIALYRNIGIDEFVVGSAVFNTDGTIADNIESLAKA